MVPNNCFAAIIRKRVLLPGKMWIVTCKSIRILKNSTRNRTQTYNSIFYNVVDMQIAS